MRAVLDANVFVSAAISTGPPHRVAQRWLEQGEFDVVACPLLIALAQAHGADFIVSGDQDLLSWLPQIPPVVTPAQFEEALHAAYGR